MKNKYKVTDKRWECVLDFLIILNQLDFAIQPQPSSDFSKALSIFNVVIWSIVLAINFLQFIKIYMEVE